MLQDLTLVIPTKDMGRYLIELLASIERNSLYEMLSEIIVVNDGSTDDTAEAVRKWSASADKRKITRVQSLPENQGRFVARLTGAQLAKTKFVLFLDTRIRLPEEFGNQLAEYLRQHEAVMGTLKIDTSKSLFNLYWQRSHENLFRKTHVEEQQGVLITFENYHQHVTGTTVIACRRDYFLQACEPFIGVGLISDDTGLLLYLAKLSPIYRNSRFHILWEPRQSVKEFLGYLFNHRGATFADYHIYERWGKWTALFFAALFVLLLNLGLLVLSPGLGLLNLIGQLGLVFLSTALFSNSFAEFIRMAPLHTAVVLSYGFGAIYGIFKVGLKRLKSPVGKS